MAERSRTPGDDAAGAILYVHGGGYVFGSLDSHRHVVTEIGRAAGVPSYALHYRLAPEHPFPAPVEDTVAAYRALLAQGIAPGRIAVVGDSAGGGLVVAALVAFREAGLPQPACGWSISPWIDLEALGPSMTGNAASDPSVQRDPILELARLYLAGADPRSPLAAPLYADLKGIAPLLIQAGAIETLLDDAVRLAGRAAAAGVPTRLDVWPEMPHVWHLFHPVLTAGRKAIEQGGAFVKAAMTEGAPFTYRG
jgi:acetyl esterase/lipase